MKQKFLLISSVVIFSLLLGGCAGQAPAGQTGVPGETPAAQKDSTFQGAPEGENSVTLDQVLATAGTAAGLSNPDKMRIRREVDNISLDDEGRGYVFRPAGASPKFEPQILAIDQALSAFGFSIQEETPKNAQSTVTKYIKYQKGNIACTLEIRKIGTTGQMELSFGCLE